MATHERINALKSYVKPLYKPPQGSVTLRSWVHCHVIAHKIIHRHQQPCTLLVKVGSSNKTMYDNGGMMLIQALCAGGEMMS
jgi:hypothetical protein